MVNQEGLFKAVKFDEARITVLGELGEGESCGRLFDFSNDLRG